MMSTQVPHSIAFVSPGTYAFTRNNHHDLGIESWGQSHLSYSIPILSNPADTWAKSVVNPHHELRFCNNLPGLAVQHSNTDDAIHLRMQ